MAGAASKVITRVVTIVVVLAVIAGGVYFAFFRGSDDKKVTAHFSQAVGLYPGTPVEILGVKVGKVDSVKPSGGSVTVTMSYDSQYTLPKNVYGILVANSLVSDRYIQFSPAYTGGPKLADGGTIRDGHTQGPAELDDIYSALNTLSKALGPTGVNKGGKNNGALSNLINVAAENLNGNGTALGNSITKLSQAARTLAGGRGDLFQTVANLRKFTGALDQSDKQVRLFNRQLAQVSSDLASERTDLGLALRDLGLALDDVNSFVKDNASKFHTSFDGLKRITNVLVKQKASLTETLAVAPVALANIVHAYQPNLGVLATRSNLASLFDLQPLNVCAILVSVLSANSTVKNLLGSATDDISKGCSDLLSGAADKLGMDVQQLVTDLLGGASAGAVGTQVSGLIGSGGGTGGSGTSGGGLGSLGGLIGTGSGS